MSLRSWSQPGYRLMLMFFGVAAVLTAVLAWMGWKLVAQDRLLERQRLDERREGAADLAVSALKEKLLQEEGRLMGLVDAVPAVFRDQANSLAARLPEDSALLVFSPGAIEAYPAGRLLFYPDAPPPPANPPAALASADALEFQARDYLKAATTLQALAQSKDAAIRAEARWRLGRCWWKAGMPDRALAAYAELEAAGEVLVSGLPARLVALESRLLILEGQKSQAARREAALLDSALRGGKWRLGRAAYEFYMEEAGRILGSGSPAPSVAASEAAETMLREWQAVARGEGRAAGRRMLWCRDQPMLLLWRGTAQRLAALALGPACIEGRWLHELEPAMGSNEARITLSDLEGRAVSGTLPMDAPSSVRLASATQLPWTLHAVSTDEAGLRQGSRRLIVTGLLTLVLVVVAGGYFIGRAAAREFAVARLQSDFVASVSHEFRTPVTAMRQLSELLATGRVAGEEDRDEYYRALVRESGRLHRLVEGLLTFGRMEAGSMHFRFEPLDPAEFASSVVAEFQREGCARGHQVELSCGTGLPLVSADRTALGCVLWNLLDNAVKYSPDCLTIRVDASREDGRVAFRVRDRGIGIPPGEQREVFEKFTRGAAAKAGGIQGAGVGLAMARQIVAAHRGEIRLESRPGEGSTFTVLLPEGSRASGLPDQKV